MSEIHTVEVKCMGDPDKIVSAIRNGLSSMGYAPETIVISAQQVNPAPAMDHDEEASPI